MHATRASVLSLCVLAQSFWCCAQHQSIAVILALNLGLGGNLQVGLQRHA